MLVSTSQFYNGYSIYISLNTPAAGTIKFRVHQDEGTIQCRGLFHLAPARYTQCGNDSSMGRIQGKF